MHKPTIQKIHLILKSCVEKNNPNLTTFKAKKVIQILYHMLFLSIQKIMALVDMDMATRQHTCLYVSLVTNVVGPPKIDYLSHYVLLLIVILFRNYIH